MARIRHYMQLIIFDALAIIFMIAAILTGWLPGPGGIPLFVIGLSLLAINHEWAERYIRKLQKYVNMIGDIIFIQRLRVIYDLLAPTLIIWGVLFILSAGFSFARSVGTFMIFLGIVIFFGNRDRWEKLKEKF